MQIKHSNNSNSPLPLDQFIYISPQMKEIYYEMRRCAKLANTILLEGESGVGKDRIAFEIHRLSKRKNKSFVCVPIHSLSNTLIESELFGYEKGAFSGADHSKAGRFEATDGGTIYLPEISELSESTQLKLLYFLQYRTVTRVGQNPYQAEKNIDVNLIFATNTDAELLVEQGKIRSDFYHRINIVQINIPPLRERKEDIEPLVKYFINKYSKEFYNKHIGFDQSVIELFEAYDWPGNIRELENAVERTLIKLDQEVVENDKKIVLSAGDFSVINEYECRKGNGKSHRSLIFDESQKIINYKSAQANFQKQYFEELLKETNGNISLAAKLSYLSPQGLRKILKRIE